MQYKCNTIEKVPMKSYGIFEVKVLIGNISFSKQPEKSV